MRKGSVADPDPGPFLPLDSGSDCGMNIPDHISESLYKIFALKIPYKNSFMRIRDPESF